MKVFLSFVIVLVAGLATMPGCQVSERVTGDESLLARPGVQLVKNAALRIAAEEVVRRGLLDEVVNPDKASQAIDLVAMYVLSDPPNWDGAYSAVALSISPQYQPVARDILTMSRMLAGDQLSDGQRERFRSGVQAIVSGAKAGLTSHPKES